MSDPVLITLILAALVLILSIIGTAFAVPRKKELNELREIVHELIGLTPAAKERWGMPEPDEILSELKRLRNENDLRR